MFCSDPMSGSHFIAQTSKFLLIDATAGCGGGRGGNELKTVTPDWGDLIILGERKKKSASYFILFTAIKHRGLNRVVGVLQMSFSIAFSWKNRPEFFYKIFSEICLEGSNCWTEKSSLVQVMVWCHQASSHNLNQCWLRSMTQYVTLAIMS